MLWPYLSSLLLVGGCRCGGDREAPAVPAPAAIEVRDAAGVVTARVVPGRPCRARVEGVELLVGGQPLVAQHGAVRWSGEDAANGTTLSKDGAPVARVYARQLFDADGLPVLRVMEDGSIADRASAIVRRAVAVPAAAAPPAAAAGSAAAPATGPGSAAAPATGAVQIGDTTVTGTTDVVLAAMLAAPEIAPDLRAIVACHLLLREAR